MIGSIAAPLWFSFAILGAVAGQRLGELAISYRNTRTLKMRGAVELGASHYPILVALHACWLFALLGWVALYSPRISLPLLLVFAGLQAVRLWILWALGPFWTTRIITLPEEPLMRRGPYRHLRHPNYLVVVIEIAILPLAFGAWMIAALFSVLNAAALYVRIRAENAALASRR